MKGKSTIWILTDEANNYDQPPDNLVAWWCEKPRMDILARVLGGRLAGGRAAIKTALLFKLLRGETVRFLPYDDTHYTLREVKEGKVR